MPCFEEVVSVLAFHSRDLNSNPANEKDMTNLFYR